MKPEDLKYPFIKTPRKITIQDRVWFVPSQKGNNNLEEDFSFPGWESIFGNNHPVNIEYCSGNGAWIAAKAMQNPNQNWVAVEIKFDRVRKIWSKIKNHQLNNLIIISGEAFFATKHFIPSQTIQEIYINFPDPWPKKRHYKNRIIQNEFMAEMHRILANEGLFTFVTDDENFSSWTIDILKDTPQFKSIHPEPHFITYLENYGTSYFENLWREKGKTIRYHQFRR